MAKIPRKITEAKRMHPSLHPLRILAQLPRRCPDIAVTPLERQANAPQLEFAHLLG